MCAVITHITLDASHITLNQFIVEKIVKKFQIIHTSEIKQISFRNFSTFNLRNQQKSRNLGTQLQLVTYVLLPRKLTIFYSIET